MALFQLDPASIVARVRASGQTVQLPTLAASFVRGIIGFTIVSVAGFAPWPLIDRFIAHPTVNQLYVACTAVFIGLSGPCLHRLIIGPGSLSRCYKLFTLAFVAYAIGWITCWELRPDDLGGLGGLLAGTALMGAILSLAFDHPRAMPKTILALFLLNTAGYYAGGKLEGLLGVGHRHTAQLLWGACYGIGFGAGLGAAFYFCQERVRALLASQT
ncbi:MAG TPA: hypothetical protein VK961_04105 [Chthoniobacter sp.]|nr:hypothetical protein [Chthoniobacter sp.]